MSNAEHRVPNVEVGTIELNYNPRLPAAEGFVK